MRAWLRFPMVTTLRRTLAPVVLALFAHASLAAAQTVSEVRVERVRPPREKHATLRFLKDNRDFIRGRFDLLRAEPRDGRGAAAELDPRLLAYQAMLANVLAARDSVANAEDARGRRTLLASIGQLGEIESDLDRMERLLAEQRTRLGVLQENFTGDQQTALVVVVSGAPAGAAVSGVAITLEDGATLLVDLDGPQRETLAKGGVVQVFHGFVEPRRQVVEIELIRDRLPSGGPAFVTLEPARDRLTFLRLDLSAVGERGAADVHAGTWTHDSRLPARDG